MLYIAIDMVMFAYRAIIGIYMACRSVMCTSSAKDQRTKVLKTRFAVAHPMVLVGGSLGETV